MPYSYFFNMYFMNVFRLLADATHLLSRILLLFKLGWTRSSSGISLKTQQLYALVFVCRYLDLFTNFISMYLPIMKSIYLTSTFITIGCMCYHHTIRATYERELDSFPYQFLIPPCVVLALLLTVHFTVMEELWTFSIFLEAVALVPQLWMMQRANRIDNLTLIYVFLVGSYRGFYILNWAYRVYTEFWYYQHPLVWVSGIVQCIIYIGFIIYYVKTWREVRSRLFSKIRALARVEMV